MPLPMDIATVPEGGKLWLFLFDHPMFLCAVAGAWFVFSIVTSIRTKDWSWFARSGAILALAGGMLVCRAVLRFTPEERIHFRNKTSAETATPSELAAQERDSLAMELGVGLLITGMIIWAYGDWFFPRGSTLANLNTSSVPIKPPPTTPTLPPESQ